MRAVRIIKQTISIFLAAQLLVSFGLCGGLCCVKAAELPAPQVAEQAAEPEENLPPCHRKKAAEKAASQQSHQTNTAGQAASKKHLATLLNRDCCAMKPETPDGEPLPAVSAPQAGKLVATLKTSPWDDNLIAAGLPPIPIPNLSTHSPPFGGFQLSLRI